MARTVCANCGNIGGRFTLRGDHWLCVHCAARWSPAPTAWHGSEAVVVYRKPNGQIVYPGKNDRPTPAGMERVVMRSDREVARFEREHRVVNEARHGIRD